VTSAGEGTHHAKLPDQKRLKHFMVATAFVLMVMVKSVADTNAARAGVHSGGIREQGARITPDS
jgi:hypothetical protein